MADLDTLRPEVRAAMEAMDADVQTLEWLCIRAELLRLAKIEEERWAVVATRNGALERAEKAEAELRRLADENARLNKIESLATEQRLQMEDVELYLMDVSQPDDGDAPWCDRMKSAIELLVQDCNYAVGQKNKAEAELAALKARIAGAPVYEIPLSKPLSEDEWMRVIESVKNERSVRGKRVRLVVEEQ